jgi:CheY-like chemotaxis protein
LARVLAEAGYRVTTAASGQEALALCKQQMFSAITLDLLLPDSPGSQVLQEIRAGTPNANTPVIVVTVLAQSDLGVSFAIQEHLIKPVSGDELLAALDRAGVLASSNSRILVVDDDATVRELLQSTLKSAGFEPVCVADGSKGLEVAAQGEIGAIVLDLMMPEMDGFEFLHRFRASPEGRRVPVIVLTAKDLTGQDRRRLEDSTQAVLSKADGSGTKSLLAELGTWVSPQSEPALVAANGEHRNGR